MDSGCGRRPLQFSRSSLTGHAANFKQDTERWQVRSSKSSSSAESVESDMAQYAHVSTPTKNCMCSIPTCVCNTICLILRAPHYYTFAYTDRCSGTQSCCCQASHWTCRHATITSSRPMLPVATNLRTRRPGRCSLPASSQWGRHLAFSI